VSIVFGGFKRRALIWGFRHQKQALTFCLARERSWQLTSGRDVWTFKRDETAAGQSREVGSYMNEVTQEFHREPPPDFRGGMIADTMGSGKSLAMIALVAHDMVVSNHDADRGPTLFIVPSQCECRILCLGYIASYLEAFD
jgi:hypothetical protein